MRARLLLFALPFLPSGAILAADQAPSEKEVVQLDRGAAAETLRAASRRAVESLYDHISAESITSTVTVGSFIKDLDVKHEFMKTLYRADQIGGPRWLDQSTVQVQLEIPTERVVYALKQLKAAYPKQSPVTIDQIEHAAQDWPRVFSATGTSAAAKALVEIRPAASGPWAQIPDAARQKALSAANTDATRRVMDSVSPVVLEDHTTLADGFANPKVGDQVRQWLSQRPVTRVDFRDNLQVEVALAVDEQDLFSVVRDALSQQNAIPLPKDSADWKRIERDFNARFIPAVGRASVKDVAPPVERVQAAPLPTQAPTWVTERIDVQGSADPVQGFNRKLRTAIAAERDARNKLQARIEAFPYDKGMTVGEAAKHDPRLARAVERTIQDARVYRTTYRADGTVEVKVMADMRDLWDELRR